LNLIQGAAEAEDGETNVGTGDGPGRRDPGRSQGKRES
jgi:hypothetical protein